MKRTIEDIKIKKKEGFSESRKKVFDNVEKTERNENSYQFQKIKESNKEKFYKEPFVKRLYTNPQPPKDKTKIKKTIFSLFILSFLIGLVFWGASLFEEVNITISKKNQIFELEKENFVASKNKGEGVSFEIMILSDEKLEKINLVKSEEVSLKSKGEIVLYNEYNKEVEKLVANTYLSDENGIVYLTDTTVSIPGYKEKEGILVPGQISVSATAFLPGESYNGEPSEFTINAYKNTPKFKKIYGKAKTPFSGGASGLRYSLEEKDKEILLDTLDSSLQDDLLKKVDSLIPKEYIFYPNAHTFSPKVDEEVLSKTPEADINVSGILSVVLLKEDDLKNAIIKKKIPNISKEEINKIEIKGINNLVLNFTNEDLIVSKDLESVPFSLTGKLDFIWNPDSESLRSNLKGVSKDNILEIFKKDIGIEDASLKIFPPWGKTLPLEEKRIKIKII